MDPRGTGCLFLVLSLLVHATGFARALSTIGNGSPRGTVRIVYCQDSGIIRYNTWDPFSPDQLRAFVDNLADNGVDIYAQLVYSGGRVRLFRPDKRDVEQMKVDRFEPMIEAGTQPIEVLIDQSHKRNLRFLAKFRMSDTHSKTGFGFVAGNPELQLKQFPGAVDYSHEKVRDYVVATMEEVVRRFDVDGLELNFIRSHHCFPPEVARERQPVMTEFIRRIRAILDEKGKLKKRKLLLGVRVQQTLEECHNLGYDVTSWVRGGLINYVAPSDSAHSDFNAPYEEFAALTRNSQCMLYPAIHPPVMVGVLHLMRPENYRALARTIYASGADGISVFNYMYHWGRQSGVPRYSGPVSGYPLALSYLRELRDPEKLARLPRHYLFYPLWSNSRFAGKSPTGAIKNDRLILARDRAGQRAEYRFRMWEDLSQAKATLFVTALGLRPEDELELDLNGHKVFPAKVQRAWNGNGRWDWGVEWADPNPEVGQGKRRWTFDRALPPFSALWVDLAGLPVVPGVNRLGARLLPSVPRTAGEVVIDEVEVTVIPKRRRSP